MKSNQLFFVHGINNEGTDAATITSTWLDDLKFAWSRDSLPIRVDLIEVGAAYYGDALSEATRHWVANDLSIIDLGEGETAEDADVIALYREYQRALEGAGRVVPRELDVEAVEMGFPHHQSVKAAARIIEAMSPEDGSFLARRFLPQAAVYVKRPGTRNAINRAVEAQFTEFVRPETNVVLISHSLGTVVSYCFLRNLAPQLPTSAFVTLGSPLGTKSVQKILPFPRTKPSNVTKWINAADARDFVSIRHILDNSTFGHAEINNLLDVSNAGESPHSISGYLRNPLVSKAIWDCLEK